MPNTMKLISSYTATGTVSSIDFSSIPQTYTDLMLYASLRISGSGEVSPPMARGELVINNTTTGGFYNVQLLYGEAGVGAGAGSPSDRNFYSGVAVASGATANTFSNCSFYITNYASSAVKSCNIDSASENVGTYPGASITGFSWTSTSPINRLTLKDYGGSSFVQYSSFFLYGIKNS
jgi:hypothetical protein